MRGWGTALAAVGTGLSFLNATSADRRARDTLALQQEGIDESMRVNARLEDFYDGGASALGATLDNTLNAFGDFGAITPDRFNDFYDFIATNRSAEELGNQEVVGDYYNEMMGNVGFMDMMDTNSIYNSDMIGSQSAPQTLDFAPLADDLAQKFLGAKTQNTDREIARAYGRALANIPAGMENSTMRVQMERSLADLAAQRRNEDVLSSIDDAFKYIGGLQTAGSTQQNMTNTERKMQADLLERTFGRRADNFNYYTTARNAPIEYTNNMRGMRNNTAVTDYNTALTMTGTENELRNSALSQNSSLATAPFDYAATGAQTVGNNLANVNSGVADLAGTYGDIAKGAAGGFGYSLDSLIKRLG